MAQRLKFKNFFKFTKKSYLVLITLSFLLFISFSEEVSRRNGKIKMEVDKMPLVLETPKKLKEEVVFWEKETEKESNWRDAWLKLSSIYYQLNDLQKAKVAITKTSELDPNYEPTKQLQELINNGLNRQNNPN